jgi:hypothetical protein
MESEATTRIDAYIAGLPAWERETVSRLRALVHEADPEVAEEWKWDTPVFSRRGQVCAIGVFKDHIKVNFFKGASLPDPRGLFNAGLEAKNSRGIDIREGDAIDEAGLVELVRTAVARNR